MTDTGRIAALEERIAKLEAAAVLFEEHRQAAIRLNEQLKELDEQLERERREHDQKKLERAKYGGRTLWEQIHDTAAADNRVIEMLARIETRLDMIAARLDHHDAE